MIKKEGVVTNYAKGVMAEERARSYLRESGYKILETRYKTKFGEIDIIAEKGAVLCFVEVKIRQTLEDALMSVTPRARKRIELSALHFLSVYPEYVRYDMRFDVVAITASFDIVHLDNAWESSS